MGIYLYDSDLLVPIWINDMNQVHRFEMASIYTIQIDLFEPESIYTTQLWEAWS